MELTNEETDKNDPPVRLFKELYKDTYVFDELSSMEPMDWINIPKPIQLVLTSIKKCLVANNKQLTEITEKLHAITTRYKKRLDGFEEKIERIETNTQAVQERTEQSLLDMKVNLTDEMTSFKDKLSKDVNFKVKNLEGKAAYNDEQVFNLKKIVGGMPTIDDITKSIREKGLELKEIVKEEINSFYLQPAVTLINNEIEQIKSEKESFVKVFEGFKNESSERLKALEGEVTENLKKLKTSLTKTQNTLSAEIRQSETEFEKQFENQNKTLEALSTSFHELNHKCFTDIVSLQREIEQQKSKNSEFIKTFEQLRKTIEDEKSLFESPSEHQITSQHSTPKISESEHKPIELAIPSRKIIELSERPAKKQLKHPPKRSEQQPGEDFTKKLSALQNYTEKKLELLEARLNKEINETIIPLEHRMKEVILRNESDFVAIKEKLAWLPMSFSQIQGRSPTEARIFTLEARLRAEENTRHEAVNKVMQILNTIERSSPTLYDDSSLPPLRTISVVHERNYSQDSGLANESIRKQAESELSHFSNAFRPGNSHFLKKSSLRNSMDGTFRGKSFLIRK